MTMLNTSSSFVITKLFRIAVRSGALLACLSSCTNASKCFALGLNLNRQFFHHLSSIVVIKNLCSGAACLSEKLLCYVTLARFYRLRIVLPHICAEVGRQPQSLLFA